MLVAIAIFLLSDTGEAAKQRKWLGPSNFVEVSPSTTTHEHGMASIDENIYIFGGNSNTGQAQRLLHPCNPSVHIRELDQIHKLTFSHTSDSVFLR